MLDLRADPADLTAALGDIPSVSGDERRIADDVERALRGQTDYEVVRNGNAVLARTDFGRPTRVLLAGHLDTVPIADNVPARRDGDHIYGCGSSDMKSGDAVFLHLAATIATPAHDLTLIFYDCEEIEAPANGLGRIERELPDWLHGDVAILGEPSDGTAPTEVIAAARELADSEGDETALVSFQDAADSYGLTACTEEPEAPAGTPELSDSGDGSDPDPSTSTPTPSPAPAPAPAPAPDTGGGYSPGGGSSGGGGSAAPSGGISPG